MRFENFLQASRARVGLFKFRNSILQRMYRLSNTTYYHKTLFWAYTNILHHGNLSNKDSVIFVFKFLLVLSVTSQTQTCTNDSNLY